MQHCREEGVGHLVTGDVDHRDTRLVLTALQVAPQPRAGPSSPCPGDPRLEIEAMLEVDVDDVVATDRAVERQRAAPHVDAVQARHVAGQRHQVLGDALEIIEFASEALSSWSASDGVMKMRGESQAYAISL